MTFAEAVAKLREGENREAAALVLRDRALQSVLPVQAFFAFTSVLFLV